jgi:hypothetical protein
LAIGLKHGPAHHGSAHDDQVRKKPTGLPKSSASVMGIKLEKSNGQIDIFESNRGRNQKIFVPW